mmetsp:Transcript_1876/g.6320  ORF Transcript_1876/g.6320 Transcript_1876/m.6320 type:complete len:288 (+) Transcript_1876:16-879(+)
MASSEAAALERILDAAVDDFEGKTPGEEEEEKPSLLAKLDEAVEGLRSNPDFEDTIATTLKAVSGNVEGMRTIDQLLALQKQRMRRDPPEPEEGADRTIAKTMELLATESSSSNKSEGLDASRVESVGEEMMTNVIAEFEKFGQKEDFNQVVEDMMRQLLARDLMYEPAKLVCETFPAWLAMHKETLTEDSYIKYGTQYQYFQRIVAVYEREPDNFPRLMELFQDLQKYGQPPAEIIQELAPGLHFTDDGMPVTNVDANVFPHPGAEPGMPSIPMPDPDAAAQCPVM